MTTASVRSLGGRLLVAAAVGLSAPAPTLAASETGAPLRVLTFNVLHDGPLSGFIDNGTRLNARLDMTIEMMKRMELDVVALQEASHSRVHGNVPGRMAQALGMHMVHAPATDRIFGVPYLDRFVVWVMGFREGSAILSRYPILESEVYDLQRCVHRLEPRILLRADVASPWGSLSVYSAHTARGDDCQLRQVLDIVRQERKAGPSIVMGDFNSLESSRILTELKNREGFVDAYRTANPDDPGATVWQRIHQEAATADRRVDFILLSAGTVASATVRSSRVVLDRPNRLADGSVLWPSDHYGVWAEIDWIPRRTAAPSSERPR